MRPVGLTDMDLAARVLLRYPQDRWATVAQELVVKAAEADEFRKTMGRVHPSGGTGSLYAQAALRCPIKARCESVAYARALRVVLDAVLEQKVHMPEDDTF